MRKIRAMLKQAGLGMNMWCYAADVAVYLTNRTIHTAIDEIPCTKFLKRKVNLDNLVTFGCIGVAHIDKEKRSSGQIDRGECVRMLGYDNRYGTYLVMNKKGSTYRSRVTKWYEDVYTFYEAERQLPSKARNRIKSIDVDRADEILQEKENEINEEIKKSETKDKNQNRRSSRSKRIRKNRLNFIPGVNYVPGMYYLNSICDADDQIEPDISTYHDNVIEEIKESSTESSRPEFLLETAMKSMMEIENVPSTYKKAILGPDKDKWEASMIDELRSQRERGTWKVVERPKHKNVVGCKWVYKKKLNSNGSIRYKSRLVAKGYTQKFGEDYMQTYAPTLSMPSFRLLVALASKFGLDLNSIDIVTAFLYGNLDTPIYMELPDGFMLDDKSKENFSGFKDPVLLLSQTIYGLKQSAYAFHKHLTDNLKAWGFKQCYTDPCLLVKNIGTRKMIVGLYVDNFIIAHESRNDLNWLFERIGKVYKFHDEGPLTWTLGLEISRGDNGKYSIGQQKYLQKLKEKFLSKSVKVTTPIQNVPLDFAEDSPLVDSTRYKSLLGALLYVALATRPDVAFTCSRLAQFSENPREIHWDQAIRCLHYLINTIDCKLNYNKDSDFSGYADASFAICKRDGKSVTGYVLSYAGAPVIWRSFKQSVVATSTGVAEYMALSPLCKEVVYATQLCEELGFKKVPKPVIIFDDSEPAIAIAMGRTLSNKSRSIRLSYHNVRDAVVNNLIDLRKVSGKTNPADILTKPLSKNGTSKYASIFFKQK